MKIHYEREIKGNYLVIETDSETEDRYGVRMLEQNQLEGFLTFRLKQIDQKKYYYYDITSKQSLSKMLEPGGLEENDIKKIVFGINYAVGSLERYLLNEQSILLDQEYIYVNSETFGLYFCYLPGYNKCFSDQFSSLLQYLIQKTDYRNPAGMLMACSLFQLSQRENCGLEEFLKLANKSQEIGGNPNELPPPESVCGSLTETTKRIGIGELVLILFMVGMPFLLWIIKGFEMVRRGFIYILIWEGGCSVYLLFSRHTAKACESSADQYERLSDYFEQEAEAVAREKPSGAEIERPDHALQTVLLADCNDLDLRRLVSIQVEMPDIIFSYYPFIIGKQQGVADYILDKETISRIHVRFDEKQGHYYMTDLNSTNGSLVKGVAAEANEMVQIFPGDEICLADFRFRFI